LPSRKYSAEHKPNWTLWSAATASPPLLTLLASHACAQIVEEVHRWRPSVPLGLNHASAEDDWYEGMFIPKGTVCVGNIWHCNHDRAVFGEAADEFRPERHLDERGDLLSGSMETVQAGHITFVFGQRVCVGKYLAIDTLFITTARMLRAAKLERVRDESGKEAPLDLDTLMQTGLVA